ncbi:MAG: macro domain-containing protein [Planctomycetes bacterium]|nr:macro domain-containing protein [Planctomycetota bacterium]
MEVQVNHSVVELIEGDITGLAVDAIVNAANAQLVLGGGVAGAIARKGGDSIQRQCNEIGGAVVGAAVITGGGDLKAAHVIHAVGPRLGEGDEDNKLRDATRNSLKVADENKLASIAFPAISTGIFGFAMDKCAAIMLSETVDYLKGETSLKKVVFCLYDEDALEVFVLALREILGQS